MTNKYNMKHVEEFIKDICCEEGQTTEMLAETMEDNDMEYNKPKAYEFLQVIERICLEHKEKLLETLNS